MFDLYVVARCVLCAICGLYVICDMYDVCGMCDDTCVYMFYVHVWNVIYGKQGFVLCLCIVGMVYLCVVMCMG